MENILVTLFCIAILLTGALTIALYSFNSIDMLVYAWKDGEALANDVRHTAITAVSSNTTMAGAQVEIVLKNDGQTNLANFSKWDVIIRYQSGTVQWLPYTTNTPGWTVSGLFLNGVPEIYEPNIFNPMETMKLILKLSTPVPAPSTNLVTVSTPNGVDAEITFGR